MKPVALALLLAAAVASVSCESKTTCGCLRAIGLALVTAEPVTSIEMSGPACQGATWETFQCTPSNPQDNVDSNCRYVRIYAKAAGLCVVDVTAGMTFHLEREMVLHNDGCCGISFGEKVPSGNIDLRPDADGGTDSASS